MGGHWELPGTIKRHFFRRKDRETVIIGTCLTLSFLEQEVEQLGGLKKPLGVGTPNFFSGGVFPYSLPLASGSSVKTVLQSLDPAICFSTPIPRKLLRAQFFQPWIPLVVDLLRFRQKIVNSRLGKLFEQIRLMMKVCGIAGTYALSWNILFSRPSQAHHLEREKERYLSYTRGKKYRAAQFCSASIPGKEEIRQILSFLETHTLVEASKQFGYAVYAFAFFTEEVLCHPEIEFHFFVSPYLALAYIGKQEDCIPFSQYIGGLLAFLNRIAGSPNIHLYAFDDVAEIVGNTANYYDHTHYGIGVNRYILRSIKAGKHRITKANVLEYLRRVATVLLNFDPTPDYEHTVTFEGPLTEESEEAFSCFPPPAGPSPLLP
jgi:hypothetical protein